MGQRDCIHHTGTPAVGQCHLCHKPICQACKAATPGEGLFCSQECYDGYIAYQGRKQPVIRGSRLKSIIIGLLLLLALAAGLIYVGSSCGCPVLTRVRNAILSWLP